MSYLQRSLKLLNKSVFVLKRSFAVQISQNLNEVSVEHLKSTEDGISVISLNREKQRNALSYDLVTSFSRAINTIANSDTKVLIIKSSVPGTFCAGADLKERLKMTSNEAFECSNSLRTLFTRVNHLRIPVIAALDGLALGGGLELALACDIRVAVTTAKLGLVETRLAIIPGAGGTARLPRLINPAIAKELIYTAKIIDGAEAKVLGIVNHAVSQNENGNAAYLKSLEVAREILPNGPVAIQMAKFAINKGIELDINSALTIEEACYARIAPTKDRVEGLEAFSEKRSPKYLGE